MRSFADDPAQIIEQITGSIRIAYRNGSFVIELLHRAPGQTKIKWVPSVACDTIDQARHVARIMVAQNAPIQLVQRA
jgi:N-acyl-D-aspartate/D-glutamate deacylase